MRLVWSALAIVLMSGCINIKLVTIGQKTALERQLAGTHEELDEDLALVASVRGGGGVDGGQEADDGRARALAARRRQLFNVDDLVELRSLGCLGEGNDGLVALRPCDARAREPAIAERAARILSQENEDRARIIDLALVLDPALTPGDRESLQHVYARLARRDAAPGTWVQDDAGTWLPLQ